MIIKGLSDTKPLVAGWAIVLAVVYTMHVFHVDLDMAPPLNELETH